MNRFALASFVLAGCLSDPTVQVDTDSIEVARGLSVDVLTSIDGAEVHDLSGLYWTVEDPSIATVTPSLDGHRLEVGGNLEGATVVHVSAYGQDLAIPTRVGPPAILDVWTEPAFIDASVGATIEIRAKALDSLAQVTDITFDSRWAIRDENIAQLEHSGMMLHAMGEGSTTLHVNYRSDSRLVPVRVFK